MRLNRFTVDIRQHACFDPATLMVTSLASSAVGGGLQAAGTIAGGDAAAAAGTMQKNAAYAEAAQLEENAAQSIASGQRQMFETQQKARLAGSTLRANAAANGTDAGFGSNVSAAGDIAKRGSYMAAMDMFNGLSTATGLHNQAAGVRYSGDVAEIEGQAKKQASLLAAAGTIAGSAGGMAKSYGAWQYPQNFKT